MERRELLRRAFWGSLVAISAFPEAKNKRPKDVADFLVNLLTASEKKPTSYSDYAEFFYETTREKFLVVDGLYEEERPKFIPFEYASNWSFSMQMAATIDMCLLTENQKYYQVLSKEIEGLKNYLDTLSVPESSGYNSTVQSFFKREKFYDDNAWVGLNFVRIYRLTNDKNMADHVKQIFDFIETGYDVSATCAPGGQFWKQQTPSETNHDRNTVSSLPNAKLALFLYQQTGKPHYEQEAKKRIEWVNVNLRDPFDGLNKDKIMGNCQTDQIKWSYNQNFLVDSGSEQIATTALNYFADKYFKQDPAFNAIFFRNLIALSMVVHNNDLLQRTKMAMETYVKEALSNPLIYDGDGLFRFKHGQPARLINQAAMVQIFAMLACPPEKYQYLVY